MSAGEQCPEDGRCQNDISCYVCFLAPPSPLVAPRWSVGRCLEKSFLERFAWLRVEKGWDRCLLSLSYGVRQRLNSWEPYVPTLSEWEHTDNSEGASATTVTGANAWKNASNFSATKINSISARNTSISANNNEDIVQLFLTVGFISTSSIILR